MQRNKLSVIRDYILKHCKIIFPVIVVAVVAVTVSVALGMSREKPSEESSSADDSITAEGGDDAIVSDEIPEIPLVVSEDSAVNALMSTYYNALCDGDMETLVSLHDTFLETQLLRFSTLSEYLDHCAEIQVNTKQGPKEGTVVAYVYYRLCFVNHDEEFPGYDTLYICTNDEGELYIKNEVNFTKEEDEYITAVSSQADVIEFHNRVNVEYNEFVLDNPSLLEYLDEVGKQVDIDYGVALADQNQSNEQAGDDGESQEGDGDSETPAPEEDVTPEYATATTTVNVRSSDSEQADKLGRVQTGEQVKVQEVRVNGWTKVVYEGGDGYIKSEYLEFAESAAGQSVIGTVTANTNINIRASASQTAEKLGMLSGGESLDLLAVEGDWCKIVFNNQVAYVKAEFVSVQQ